MQATEQAKAKDVALAAKDFGAYPGCPRWISVADIKGDYKIDIKDIAAIAKMLGWLPHTSLGDFPLKVLLTLAPSQNTRAGRQIGTKQASNSSGTTPRMKWPFAENRNDISRPSVNSLKSMKLQVKIQAYTG